jgi:hypothetical protein
MRTNEREFFAACNAAFAAVPVCVCLCFNTLATQFGILVRVCLQMLHKNIMLPTDGKNFGSLHGLPQY